MKKILWYSVILLWLLFILSAHTAVAITSDDFNSLALNESLWMKVDPLNDSSFTMVSTGTPEASLYITIPAGTSHDALGINNMPRIMQSASNTDFEIEVKFQSVLNKSLQIEGILIEQDGNNFIRFDFYSDGIDTRIYAGYNIDGSPTSRITNTKIKSNVSNSSIPLYMRVKRVGDMWTQNYSFDGVYWITSKSFNHTLTVTSVGLSVGNAGTPAPAFAGVIDYFFNTSSPLIPEDLNETIVPTINIWYGNSQTFGQIGVPQQWVNILGNVQDPDGISSLNYSLNNGKVNNLSVGPDTRLESIGDFNVEINHTDLLCGNNQLVITAADTLGNSRNQYVTINYFCNHVWPQDYDINWSNTTNIQDAAQIVDGLWIKEQNSIHPAIIGYDRMIAIGDMTWKDYEITSTITINSPLDSSLPIKPNFGFITRWQGHWDWRSGLPADWQFKQPRPAWYPLGALGVYIWVPSLNDYRLRIIGNNMVVIANDTSVKHLSVGVPYVFKMSAKTNGTKTTYILKVWQQDMDESTAVTISGNGVAGELKQGSATLNAHNANVSFGNVTIRSLTNEDTFPVISAISVGANEFNSTVRWTTSKTASSSVSYGLTTDYENGSIFDGNLVYSHAILLNILQPGTTYHFKINSTDSGGNSTNTADMTFTTKALMPPSITTQPVNKRAINGSTATFSVVAAGTAPLSYQWMRNGADIAGATGSSYTTPTVSPSDNNTKYSVLVSNAYGSVTSNEAILSVIEQPPVTWWNTARGFRVPVTVNAAGFERYEKPVDVSINFTQMLGVLGQAGALDETSIRVVETDINGVVLSDTVPFQFDKDAGFNATTKASGTIVFIMNGTTPENANRYYQIYFGLTGGSYSPVYAASQVTITDNITDEGQSSFRIAASGSTYYFQKQAGGFSSLVDSSGNDWISYAPIVGSAEFRGVPNVAAGGIFHPGFTCCTSSVVTQGPLKIRVRAVSPDGKWESLWDFYPGYATMTMVKANTSYFFLYEGTPGGALEPNKDFMVRPDNTKTLLSESWTNDLDAQEWAYFSDPTVDRSIFAAHHEDDPLQDTYWPYNTNVLTVFGFGRSDNPASGLLSSVPQHYTIGLMNGTGFAQNARTVYSAYKDLSITKGGIEQYNSVMLPTIMQQPADSIVVSGVSPTFSVTATGQLSLSYQWRKNGIDIPGATNASYSAPPATESDNGSVYQVAVTNIIGSVISVPANLTVISGYSNNQLVVLDVNYEHNTVITKVPYSGGSAVSGKSSSFFNFPSYVPSNFKSPIDYAHGTMYQRLQVLTKPSSKMAKYQICMFQTNITTSQHACTNRDLLAFTGTGTYYATQSMTSLFQYSNLNWTQKLLIMMLDITDKNGVLIDDRTAYNFNKTWDGGNTNLGLYYPMQVRYTAVIVPPGGGEPIWPVDTPPSIATQPANQTTVIGDVSTFSVAATGTAPLHYQWQKNGVNIDGAYSSSYTIPPATAADNGSIFRVIVSNALGSITSNGSVLTLVPSINLIQNPGFELGTTSSLTNWAKYQLNAGATLSKVTPGYDGTSAAKLAITSVGKNPDIQLYQTGIPLEQARYLEPNTRYRLLFAAYSNTGHDMTVKLVRATSLTTSYGLAYTANLNNSWQVFTTEFNTTNFTSKVKDGRLQFRLGGFAKVGDNYFIDNVSLEKVIAEPPVPPQVIGNAPNGTDVPVTTVISVNFSKPMNQASVQSAFSTSPATAGSFSWSGNNMTFTPDSNLTYSTTYNVTVGTAAADLAGNNMAVPYKWNFTTMDLDLIPPSVTIQTLDQNVKVGDAATFNVVATGTLPLIYQWQRNGVDISGATSATYTTPSTTLADNGTAFSVMVSNIAGSITSNNVTLIVVLLPTAPTITMQPSNQTVNEAEAAAFSVVAMGTMPLIYQWQKDEANIPGATNATYTIPSTALSDNGSAFRVNITNSAGSVMSDEATLVIVQRLLINIVSPADGSIDTTGNVNVTVTLNRPGIAVLNWEGTNESMVQQGTSFYVNKTGLLSGNYNFKVYANDSNGVFNISEPRNIKVDRNLTISFEDIINTTTFITGSTKLITSPGGNVAVTIFNNTNASVNNSAVTSISIDSLAKINSTFVAHLGSDKLVGENITLGPQGAIFNPDIQLRFNYSGAQLTAAGIGSASQLRIKFYNKTTNSWDALTPYTLHQNGSDGYLIANTSHFSTFALIGVPALSGGIKCCTGGGSGGGGGGGKSAENSSNIELIEKYDMEISRDTLTSYKFKDPRNPIMFVNITGNTSLGVITASLEVLKATSTIVNTPPEGLVYKNVNIWVGTSGFATPKNIKEAFIEFRIDNNWMSANNVTSGDIILVKWNGNSWIRLETKEVSKDDTNTYFEGRTDSFSPFAISGIIEATPSVTPSVTSTTPIDTPLATVEMPAEERPGMNWPLISGVVLVVSVVMVLYIPRKGKSG
ncbi:MAG: PGF-pre-PGF domain-containing protein [Candidatus Methanoperedens sp.]